MSRPGIPGSTGWSGSLLVSKTLYGQMRKLSTVGILSALPYLLRIGE